MSRYMNSVIELSERRESSRIAVEIGAKAIVANSNNSLECTILDISKTGAKIELEGLDIVPARMMLYIPEVDCTFTCEVAWRTEKHLGLKFVNSQTF